MLLLYPFQINMKIIFESKYFEIVTEFVFVLQMEFGRFFLYHLIYGAPLALAT